MKGKRYSEEQIVRILKEVESGKPVAGVCREYGVSEQSVYRWRTKYGGMEVSDVRRRKQLEEENARLKELVADQVQVEWAWTSNSLIQRAIVNAAPSRHLCLRRSRSLGHLGDMLLAVVSCLMQWERLIRALCSDLMRLRANVFAQGYPRLVAPRIVCPGLKGSAAEC